jgi:hypothetical protein
VLAITSLISAHVIGADNLAVLLGNERFPIGTHPMRKSIGFAHVVV